MSRLRQILDSQGQVARAYSPLCASVLSAVAAEHDTGGAMQQSIEDYYTRVVASTNLEKSLRVAAVLHQWVLRRDARVANLADYYATIGGEASPDSADFVAAVRAVLREHGPIIFEQAIAWRVQTNETARGLAWLLPMTLLDVDAVHLIELGASAGLNLYAEQRRYAVEDAAGTRSFGAPGEPQFVIPSEGLELPAGLELNTPEVLSRHGGDMQPIDIRDAAAMDVLRACIWGDQPERFRRLEEALQIHRDALGGGGLPVAQVHRATLPEELEGLLRSGLPARPEAPVVVFNTYVTAYFSDVEHRQLERNLRRFAHEHALTHRIPWVWVRFEPARDDGQPGPHANWCRWRVELFEPKQTRQIDLGWAHPHMAKIEFGSGLAELLALREHGA